MSVLTWYKCSLGNLLVIVALFLRWVTKLLLPVCFVCMLFLFSTSLIVLCFRHISYSCGCTAFMHTCHVYCTVYSNMLFYDWIEFLEKTVYFCCNSAVESLVWITWNCQCAEAKWILYHNWYNTYVSLCYLSC